MTGVLLLTDVPSLGFGYLVIKEGVEGAYVDFGAISPINGK
jgi:hypothetical protein